MKRAVWKKGILLILLGMLLFPVTIFADVERLNVSQILQSGNDVYLYVNALDAAGKPAADTLTAEQLTVSLNKKETLPVLDAAVFQSLDQGISYTFCIDISKSVTDSEMEEIRNSITNFANNMGSNDFARIITIGSEITSVCDITQDRNALNAAVQGIGRTADYTYLYKGISYALDGQRKSVDAVPKRAVLILFTDGMDDSDGASGTEQVNADVAQTRVPIYVVGLKGNDSSANLGSVGQIARDSGGDVYSYSDMSITDAVQTIGDVMRGAYQLHVQPSEEAFDTGNQSWNVTFSPGGYSVVSKDYDFSLTMENVVFATPTPEPTATPTPEPTAMPTPTPSPSPTPTPSPSPSPTPIPTQVPSLGEKISSFVLTHLVLCIVIFAAAAALIVILVLWQQRRNDFVVDEIKKDGDQEGDKGENPDLFDEKRTTLMNQDTDLTRMNEEVEIKFEISFEGREETVTKQLSGQLTLGRGPECDIDVALGSPSEARLYISRKHAFLLLQPDGTVYVKNNSKNGTYLNGFRVTDQEPVKDGDVLSLGKARVTLHSLDKTVYIFPKDDRL